MGFGFRFLVAFLAVTGAVVWMNGALGMQLGHTDYWTQHGVLFLIFVTVFPRLTLLLSSVPTGGILWWLGWLMAPRLLVAMLATLTYWNQNPFLVVISWLVAVGGESSEKYVVIQRPGPPWGASEKPEKTIKWVENELK